MTRHTSRTRSTRVGRISIDWHVATEQEYGYGSESKWTAIGIALPDGDSRTIERGGGFYVEGGSEGYHAVVGGPVHAGGISTFFPTRNGKVKRSPRAALASAMAYVAAEYIRAVAVAEARSMLALANLDPQRERINP
jgi:hypothetical protein